MRLDVTGTSASPLAL